MSLSFARRHDVFDPKRCARNPAIALSALIAAFVLIFLIMMFITRSLLAALVIPATVAFSSAAARAALASPSPRCCWAVRHRASR